MIEINETVKKFLERNDFDYSIYKIFDDAFSIKSDKQINLILDKFYIPGQIIKKEISIANILGYKYEVNYNLGDNLILNLSHFFDAVGDGYHSRSVGMLEMERDECIETLKRVSLRDAIYVRECEQDKYIIVDNGLHRYNVLRFHYLNELSKIDSLNENEIKRLQDKYTIPVEVYEVDYIKTYSYCILNTLIPGIRVDAEYDSNYEKTGNAIVTISDKKKVLTDEELLDFVRRTIQKNKDKMTENTIWTFHIYQYQPSFENFLKENNIELITQEDFFSVAY